MNEKPENQQNQPILQTQQIGDFDCYERLRGFFRNNKKCIDITVWVALNIVFAGILYLVIEVFDGGFFYVFNKEAFNGYFYAWSITLVAGALTTLLLSCKDRYSCLGKVWKRFLVVSSMILLVYALCSYVRFSREVNIELENFVESLKLEKLENKDYCDFLNTNKSKVDNKIDSIIASIDTEEFVERIDKERLKEALVRYNYEVVNPIPHMNLRLILVFIFSLFVSIATFLMPYPRSKFLKKWAYRISILFCHKRV